MKPIYEILKLYHEDVLKFLDGEELNPILFEELYIYYFYSIPKAGNINIRNYIAGKFFIECQSYWNTINRLDK